MLIRAPELIVLPGRLSSTSMLKAVYAAVAAPQLQRLTVASWDLSPPIGSARTRVAQARLRTLISRVDQGLSVGAAALQDTLAGAGVRAGGATGGATGGARLRSTDRAQHLRTRLPRLLRR